MHVVAPYIANSVRWIVRFMPNSASIALKANYRNNGSHTHQLEKENEDERTNQKKNWSPANWLNANVAAFLLPLSLHSRTPRPAPATLTFIRL